MSDEKAPSDKPLVSVVLATKNRIERLKVVLDSLRLQTYPLIETIIVDDGSVPARAGAGCFTAGQK